MKGALVGEIQTYESGKFAHIPGPGGNKIGPWKPDDAGYAKLRAGKITY